MLTSGLLTAISKHNGRVPTIFIGNFFETFWIEKLEIVVLKPWNKQVTPQKNEIGSLLKLVVC